MTMEKRKADLLTGYMFFHNEDMVPTIGVLRLDTKGKQQHFVTVTRKSLLALADACRKHADQLEGMQ
jgi:hypothetical protein